MALFFLFYKLLLEKENMHVFKRGYLILALVASLLIPGLVFTEFVEPVVTTYSNSNTFINTSTSMVTEAPARDIDVINWSLIAWSIYSVGFAIFGIRFMRNLFQILNRIRKNLKQKSANFIQVLLEENFPPHTFFKYIFLNKKKLESKQIPKEVLLHEETHARQKHSYDVIFIELLQVIFWFNPLVYFFKKAIKLNHEFLADQAVLKKDIDQPTYQNTLLSYLSTDSHNKYQSVKMANAINYSSIKKRFKVMKTRTSKKSMLLRSLLLLPLLALMLYSFSENRVIFKPKIILQDNAVKYLEDIYLNIYENGTLNLSFVGNTSVKNLKKDLMVFNPNLNFKKRKEKIDAYIRVDFDSNLKILNEVKIILNKYGVRDIIIRESATLESVHDSLRMNKRIVEQYAGEKPQKTGVVSIGKEKSIGLFYQSIEDFGSHIINGKVVYYFTVNGKTSYWDENRVLVDKNGEKLIPKVSIQKNVPINQEGATPKELKEYNSLSKKYNSMLSKGSDIRIKMKEVKRLEYLYSVMSDKQKATAEPFPDFPEPPPEPEAPKRPKNVADIEYDADQIKTIIKNQDPYDDLNTIAALTYNNGRNSSFRVSNIPKTPSSRYVARNNRIGRIELFTTGIRTIILNLLTIKT